jgi:hypothetical protein
VTLGLCIQAVKQLRTALSLYLKRTFGPWVVRRLQQQGKADTLATLERRLDIATRNLASHSL